MSDVAVTKETQFCTWSIDGNDEDVWATGCDELFTFTAPGGPLAHDFRYCCYCGSLIEVEL